MVRGVKVGVWEGWWGCSCKNLACMQTFFFLELCFRMLNLKMAFHSWPCGAFVCARVFAILVRRFSKWKNFSKKVWFSGAFGCDLLSTFVHLNLGSTCGMAV